MEKVNYEIDGKAYKVNIDKDFDFDCVLCGLTIAGNKEFAEGIKAGKKGYEPICNKCYQRIEEVKK